MNMRQFKRSKLATMHYALFGGGGPIGQFLVPFVPERDVVLVATDPDPIYVVSRVKDGETVLETGMLAEAQALVEKHFRQKKAKLHVFCNGEPVLFIDGVPA